ncbi:MAG: Lrp/AsnC ligand binding domain-containing protein, partial [Armatimonadetes bacterium]|nr:Lrp/AsnC ligand binding domain-containing protein [Armatimonadota bacterium]
DALPRAPQSTFHDARTANEVLKAQERRLRLDERKGKLVDKARALMLVHRFAKEERDAILAWPARVAAEMAAELGVDAHRLQTMMDTRLREHLEVQQDMLPAWAMSGETDYLLLVLAPDMEAFGEFATRALLRPPD